MPSPVEPYFDQLLIKHISVQSQADLFPTYYNKPEVRLDLPGYSNHTNYARLNQTQHQCDNVITLPEVNKSHLFYKWTKISSLEINIFEINHIYLTRNQALRS